MRVQNKGIDFGDLHALAVGFAVRHCLQHLAGGGVMRVKALLGENDAAALSTEEHVLAVEEARQYLQVLEGDAEGVVVLGRGCVVPEVGEAQVFGVGVMRYVPADLPLFVAKANKLLQHVL